MSRKIVSMLLFAGISSVIMVPMVLASTVNSTSVSWNFSSWLYGNQSETYHTFNNGRIELHGDETVTDSDVNDGSYTVHIQLAHSTGTGNGEADFTDYTQSFYALHGDGGSYHVALPWTGDVNSSKYFFKFSVLPQGGDTVSGPGTAYNVV